MLAEQFLILLFIGIEHLRCPLWDKIMDSLYIASVELETLRINDTYLHQTFCFLGAAAWIIFVDQTTFVIHKVIEISSCSRKFLAKIIRADFEDFAGKAMVDPEDFSQDVDQALFPVQTQQHTTHAAQLDFFHSLFQ